MRDTAEIGGRLLTAARLRDIMGSERVGRDTAE